MKIQGKKIYRIQHDGIEFRREAEDYELEVPSYHKDIGKICWIFFGGIRHCSSILDSGFSGFASMFGVLLLTLRQLNAFMVSAVSHLLRIIAFLLH